MDFPREESVLPLLRRVAQAQRDALYVQGQRRQFTVTVPEAAPAGTGETLRDFDLACERDARRYGGSFGLY